MNLPKTFINSNKITYVSDMFSTFDYRNFPEGDFVFLNNVYVLSSEHEPMIQNFKLVFILCNKLKTEFPFKQLRLKL